MRGAGSFSGKKQQVRNFPEAKSVKFFEPDILLITCALINLLNSFRSNFLTPDALFFQIDRVLNLPNLLIVSFIVQLRCVAGRLLSGARARRALRDSGGLRRGRARRLGGRVGGLAQLCQQHLRRSSIGDERRLDLRPGGWRRELAVGDDLAGDDAVALAVFDGAAAKARRADGGTGRARPRDRCSGSWPGSS